jgi:hypothetical protein
MFDIFCDWEHARVLLGPRNVRALWRTDDGVAAAFRCHCGYEGVEVFGQPARRRVLQAASLLLLAARRVSRISWV